MLIAVKDSHLEKGLVTCLSEGQKNLRGVQSEMEIWPPHVGHRLDYSTVGLSATGTLRQQLSTAVIPGIASYFDFARLPITGGERQGIKKHVEKSNDISS
jgi:hypothetical protein